MLLPVLCKQLQLGVQSQPWLFLTPAMQLCCQRFRLSLHEHFKRA